MNTTAITKLRLASLLSVGLPACTPGTPTLAPIVGAIALPESLYANLRAIRDRIDVSAEAGRAGRTDSAPFEALVRSYNGLREQVASRLAAVDSSGLSVKDAKALGIMRRTLARDLNPIVSPAAACATGPNVV